MIHHLGKTFFDNNTLNLYCDLENKYVIGLKYWLFEEFDGGVEEIPNMLGNFGWINLCQVNEVVYNNLIKQFYAKIRWRKCDYICEQHTGCI